MTSNSFKKQLESHISNILETAWLQGFGKSKIKITEDKELSGATDAILYKVEANLEFVTKYHLEDVPLEKKGYAILKKGSKDFASQHLVMPILPERANTAVLLTPYMVAQSLHRIISEEKATQRWIENELYDSFLNGLKSLWRKNFKNKPNIKKLYISRIVERSKEIEDKYNIEDLKDYSFQINKEDPIMFETIFKEFSDRLNDIKEKDIRSCIIHGDEHARNIMVKKNGLDNDENAWVLIDYVKAQKNGDWIFSIAKILHWWQIYYAIENAKPCRKGCFDENIKINKTDKIIEVNYSVDKVKEKIPKICNRLFLKVINFAEDVNSDIFKEEDSIWKDRLRIALFSILLGSVPRHFKKGEEFAIPILFGEAFRSLDFKF